MADAVPKWKVGDKVWLKSGGPEMKIAYLLGDGRIRCMWKDTWGRHHSYDFSPRMVRATRP